MAYENYGERCVGVNIRLWRTGKAFFRRPELGTTITNQVLLLGRVNVFQWTTQREETGGVRLGGDGGVEWEG